MVKLINQLYPRGEACGNERGKDDNFIITYEPIINDETQETVAVLEVCICNDCSSSWVSQMYTNGDEDVEIAAMECGFRNEIEIYDDFDKEEFFE